jgi:hypothetical protein
MHGAQVDVPATFGHVVGVADVISELRPLAADFTDSCHNSYIPLGLDAERLILQETGRIRQFGYPTSQRRFLIPEVAISTDQSR